ncbi:hypothetical protein GTS_09240 [Gandjariella thermophila]|uniref:Uncharacterized protein n=1 Tax=Gandjariella thermophila TaxID=1931992 RepID=A0A4D4IYH1_9PSEU|nr:hypothetical protein GTS_09240 [Gandjariella thermophila]
MIARLKARTSLGTVIECLRNGRGPVVATVFCGQTGRYPGRARRRAGGYPRTSAGRCGFPFLTRSCPTLIRTEVAPFRPLHAVKLYAIIDEPVLNRTVGGKQVMDELVFDRLARLSLRPRDTAQVIAGMLS